MRLEGEELGGAKDDPTASSWQVLAPETQHPAPANRAPTLAGEHFNLRIFTGLADYVRTKHGAEALEVMLRRANLEPADLDRGSHWISVEQVESLHHDVFTLTGSEEAFIEACAFHFEDTYRPLRFFFMASSPERILTLAAKTMGFVSRVSRYPLAEGQRGRAHFRYQTDVPESRLMCLSRQVHSSNLTTLWGLPPAHVEEKACVAHGDDYCEYVFTWDAPQRWRQGLTRLALGLPVGAAASALAGLSAPLIAGSSLALGLASAVSAWWPRRADMSGLDEGLRTAATSVEAGLRLSELDGESSARTLGDRLVSRSAALRALLRKRAAGPSERMLREAQLRILENELTRPEFAVLDMDYDTRDKLNRHRSQVESLRAQLDARPPRPSPDDDAPALLRSERVEEAVRECLEAFELVGCPTELTRDDPLPPSVWCSLPSLQRCLAALCFLMSEQLDRTTLRAHLESQTPYLRLRLSHAGRGLAREQLDRLFSDRNFGPGKTRDPFEHAVASAVHLLDAIGARLDVHSGPAAGTTFWIRLPTSPDRPAPPPDSTPQERVVTVLEEE